jgi:hypothetical protein
MRAEPVAALRVTVIGMINVFEAAVREASRARGVVNAGVVKRRGRNVVLAETDYRPHGATSNFVLIDGEDWRDATSRS